MCIRDDEGTFVRVKTLWLSPICHVNVGEGEALGFFHGLQQVHDSKNVVDHFNKDIDGCH